MSLLPEPDLSSWIATVTDCEYVCVLQSCRLLQIHRYMRDVPIYLGRGIFKNFLRSAVIRGNDPPHATIAPAGGTFCATLPLPDAVIMGMFRASKSGFVSRVDLA